ncbi:hypothetical protein PF005_g12814 [Phytophthora fragariae]|uniref:Uncharacterized protein n=1 Tax=Phytophthora fragariae TaxID=53985 RepID=A0A6A3KQQ5_9STRA|nr:hypothetical protein PF003_g29039 [Phytophthora fragariae]KAE8936197.1 hypothetical protein PF009_g13873 [Phytophthora fragariae]KAE9006163.1 hypothetical protein PF011_g11722 [Phytophthora fragariae]KAE9107316.1 hypothetical protein PF010_g12313 [Phytophthora fragariae]KAE9108814.1 hypothetical protein PF007_g12511 [Phytophthora fragariae]
MIVDAVRWATMKVDESVVNPVASRLASSVANPAVLSFLLWDRLKTLTPQRARDLTRLLATALANALGVFGAERGQRLGASTKQLQEDFARAASSRSGRDVVLNGVATVAKVAQALNTPETKAATQQLFQTLQSVVDFFASDDGRRIISSTSECLTSATEMAASPEASVFLAELATNLLHTLESEEMRRQSAQQQEEEQVHVKQEQEQERDCQGEMDVAHEDVEEKHPYSPTSSMADTRWSFDTESMLSSAPGTPMTGMYASGASVDGPMPVSSLVRPGSRRRVSMSSPAEKSSGYRSARIEKEVLLKMGVDPSMLSEIQRVLDVIAAEEEERERVETQRRREETEYVTSLVVPEPKDDEEATAADVGIAHAFGIDEDEEKTDEVIHEDEAAQTRTRVLLPEWHEEPLREALRRRHAHAEAVSEQRDPAERQAREMAAVLAQRQIKHGDLRPADIVACQVIAKMIVYGVGLFLLLSGFMLTRNLFD